jgi:hypothetical protein
MEGRCPSLARVYRPIVNATVIVLALCLTSGSTPPRPPQQPVGDTAALRLVLNVPAYRLELLEDSAVVATLRVAVGASDYRTPLGRFGVTHITWNPWWHPPEAPWAAGDTVTPPCPTNPMGDVKLAFGNGYFIHGTPAPGSIGHAASHGCVRTDNASALGLAELIVGRVAPESLVAVQRSALARETRTLRLPALVPLEIRYDLAEVRGDSLYLYPDVYRRMPRTQARERLAVRTLVADGLPAEAIDRQALRRAIARSRRGPVVVALADLAQTTLAATEELP